MVSQIYNILYVDDEESNLRIFKMAFKRDYEVFTASSGLEAIQVLEQQSIHLIITDQKMPEMSGTEFLEKTLPNHPDIMRIILTGFSDIEAIVSAVNKANIYKYITKPWNREILKIIIDDALKVFQFRADKNLKIIHLEKENESLKDELALLKRELNTLKA